MRGEELFVGRLRAGALALGVELEEVQLEAMLRLAGELERWNRRINLVSRREEEWAERHFADSLAPLGMGLVPEEGTAVDLGSGGGFPGLPLALCRPRLRLCLAESSGKKCAFLRHAVRTLGLEGVTVLEGRFSRALEQGWGGRFQLAVSRAAAHPRELLEQALPFLRPGGRALLYTRQALLPEGRGRSHPYRLPSGHRGVIWEVEREDVPRETPPGTAPAAGPGRVRG